MVKKIIIGYEYIGHTWRKKKQDVVNALKYKEKVNPFDVVKISFGKKKEKIGWKYHALVKNQKIKKML